MKRPLILLAFVAAGPASAAGTAEMCLELKDVTAEQCTCATGALAEAIGEEDATFYDRVGTLYLANKSDGQAMADAWEAALDVVADEAGISRSDLRDRMTAAGQAHREAVAGCAG